ncbi:hypothetical protein I5907_15235 [Panacibacter sp. DH6]|uniref:Uncharacterized protein n=1 Tax=Panacibacter microcysteis TaxID=2793269 RepID=A0A931E7G7_9BACT|nr:hypothetical protein [Panacibacter microcysteis]MBG9377597.1 hypothetical protein [Panacibacter microcysteis]
MKPAKNEDFASTVSLLHNRLVKLDLNKTIGGHVVLSCNLAYPEGVVYFKTTPELVVEFLTGDLLLQALFDKSANATVEIIYNGIATHASPADTDIVLSGGNKTFREIFDFEFLL